MNIPGFTADASLYRTSASYQSTGVVYGSGERQVVFQFWSELWDGIKAVADTVWGGFECTAATGKMIVTCGTIPDTGDVAACTEAAVGWVKDCYKAG
jgi:hypothetical protein